MDIEVDLSIYVINLDRRPDRLAEISMEMDSEFIKFLRVPAVDGRELSSAEQGLVSRGQAGCWLSHQKVYHMLAAANQDVAFIFEDDASLDHDTCWPQLLRSIRQLMLSERVDILQFGFLESYSPWYRITPGILATKYLRSRRRRRSRKFTDFGPIEFGSMELGTHAYAISANAARRLKDVNNPVAVHTDLFLGMMGLNGNFRIARTQRNFVTQRGRKSGHVLDSDIEQVTSLASPEGRGHHD